MRLLLATLAGLLLLPALSLAAPEDTGLVPDTFSGYYMPNRCTLSPTPAEQLGAEPQYAGAPLYGAIRLGNAADSLITVVIDEVKEGDKVTASRIYVDANNDNDLTNDGDGAWARESAQNRSTQAELALRYRGETAARPTPYTVTLYRFTERLQDVVFYYRNVAIASDIKLGGHTVRVVLLDDNTDGLFRDIAEKPAEGTPPTGAFFVDRNLDGRIDGGSDSAEFYRGWEPFEFQGTNYKLVRVANDGARMLFEPTDEPCTPKAYIGKGLPAIDFEATDTEGKTFKLSDYKGKVVLLDFWASWCGPCKGEMPNVIASYKKYHEKGFEIVGISLDQTKAAMDAYLAENPEITWRMTCTEKFWQEPIAQLYRVSGIPAAFLIDRDGVIYGEVRGESLTKGLADLLDEAAAPEATTTEAPADGNWVGKDAPELAGTDIDGNAFKLSDLRGKVVLIDFWATWCGPCRAEIPKVVEAYEKYAGKGLVVVGVSFDRDGGGKTALDTVRAFIRENKMPWAQILQPELGDAYGVEGIPTQVIVGPDGKIAAYAVGSGALDHEAVLSKLLQ